MEPLKNSKVRLIPFDYSKSFAGITRSELPILFEVAQHDFKRFISSTNEITISSNKEFIEFYEYWKAKIDEILYRCNVTYTLSIVKNRKSSPTILAKVKWHYKLNGRLTKSLYTSVHICSVSKYFKDNLDLKDPTLIIDAENKIWNYLNRVSPLELMKITGEIYTL
jgi:hypothetical protein